MKARLLLAALTAAAFGAAAGPAAAATHWVNDDPTASAPFGTSCERPDYNSIEAAVNASLPGDVVNVCPGTYTEQVSVEPGKDFLTVRSVVYRAAVIKAPPTIAADLVNFKAIVRITTSRNVTFRDFVITGPGPFGCDSIRYGVRIDGGGQGNIYGNHITRIHDTPFSGCQNGVAVQVGRQFVGLVGQAVIRGNRIDWYQKNGPTVDNAGSRATIVDNEISGIGPTPITAQNGVQVSRGAVADVTDNRVHDNTYSLANLGVFSASGILLFQAGAGTTVGWNDVFRNDDNIAAYTTSGARVHDNRVLESTFYDGIYMGADTANNLIEDNYLRDNTEHDCHDDSTGPNNPPAFVANRWRDNDGETENKPGLCEGARGDDDDDEEDDEDGDDDDDHDDDGDDDDRHGGMDDDDD